MPVREQDHRVVARPMAALLGEAEECCDFVAGQIIAQTRVAGHASALARPPSPSSPRERSTRVDARLTARPTVRITLRHFLKADFRDGDSQPNTQSVASRPR